MKPEKRLVVYVGVLVKMCASENKGHLHDAEFVFASRFCAGSLRLQALQIEYIIEVIIN